MVPGRGLQFPAHLSFERWLGVGRQLSDIYTSSAWCLGDWLVFGEAAYVGRYREAIEQTSLDYQTLRNYAWVVKRFSLSRRRDNLSFGHHAEVAALPEAEQEFWLRKAEEFGWPVKRLRREVRGSLSERSAGGHSGQPGASPGELLGQAQSSKVSLQIHLTPEQLRACRAAASRAHLTMQDWAVLALDKAARHELDSHLRHTTQRRLALTARLPVGALRVLLWQGSSERSLPETRRRAQEGRTLPCRRVRRRHRCAWRPALAVR
jgi:hypothetical protein